MSDSILLFLVFIPLAIGVFWAGQKWAGGRAAPLADTHAPDHLAEGVVSLKAQLELLAQQTATSQAEMAKQLREQDMLLSKRLEQSLGHLSERMTQNLAQQTQSTHDNLKSLAERLAVIDNANQQITTLTSQVTSLQNILSNKTERGAFGEVQLENLVRTVLPPNAYDFQHQLSNGKRADCVLKLPNPPGDIVIDAKFPLEAWHALQDATNDAEKTVARKALGVAVKGHVKDIADKYILAGETAESACLFLPSEAVYAELHAHMPAIIEDSYRARVWIVSPTTMMATLNTVRAILRDARMREQTALIQAEIIKLIEDVARLDKRVESLGKHFGQAQKDIDDIRTSTGKITRRGEKIGEFDVIEDASDKPIDTSLPLSS
ncbi:MAG: DNA recombination protein RmuC [Candidatus Puniceispirillaceae bacterium]